MPTNLRALLSGNIDDDIKLNNKKYGFGNIGIEGISGVIDGKKKINLETPNINVNVPNPKVNLQNPDLNIQGDIKGSKINLENPDLNIKGPKVDLQNPEFNMQGNIKGSKNMNINLPNAEFDIKEPNINIDKGLKVKGRLQNPKVDLDAPN